MKSGTMKKIYIILTLVMLLAGGKNALAQEGLIANKQEVIDSLTTIDPEIIKYFPRWKVCESDLQIQIYQYFLFEGYDKSALDMKNIQVLAAPKEYPELPHEILMITCGQESMNAVEIESKMGDKLIRFLTGELIYSGINRGTVNDIAKRDYCYTDIPTETPLPASQADAIISWFEQSNVNHSFTLSLFEQTAKIGDSGFWLRSTIGTDDVGYHFWSAGEAKIVLQRPLYINEHSDSRSAIPYLINAYLGGGYRLTSGLSEDSKSMFSWVSKRKLNSSPSGKLIAGFNFHMPFKPELGLHVNAEVPLEELMKKGIDVNSYGIYQDFNREDMIRATDGKIVDNASIVPVLRATGQITAFYHWWLDKKNPENYLRFDFGASYCEVREMGLFLDGDIKVDPKWTVDAKEVSNLKTYKPNEFGDWVYAKVEYRNQAAYPFGFSMQYSNQILLGRVYLPIFGNWFYLEGKYSTPLRGARPYEIKNFFMISPVLRLVI